MLLGRRILIGSLFVLLLVAIGTADALITQDLNILPETARTNGEGTAVEEPYGIEKQEGPDVFEVLNSQGITTKGTNEENVLSQIVQNEGDVEARVILKDNDRLAFLAWAEALDAKVYFTALKEALHNSFSSELQDLVDEVQEREGKPVRNVLSFFDPAIHEERLLFIRVRQRLFEFHVAPGKEPDIQTLMDALTE